MSKKNFTGNKINIKYTDETSNIITSNILKIIEDNVIDAGEQNTNI